MPAINHAEDDVISFFHKCGGTNTLREFHFSGEYLNRYTETPTRMVRFPDAKSTVAGFEECTPYLHLEYGVTREVNPNVSVGLQGDGVVSLNNLIFAIPYDDYIPTMLKRLREGTVIDDISFQTLMWSGGEKPEILSETVFGKCHLIGWWPGRFVHMFSVRAEELLVHANSFSQEDGTNKGNNADQFNFRTNSNEVGISASGGK